MSAADKKSIAEAARVRGVTPSEFALKAAVKASKRTLARVTVIRLSQRDQMLMAEALMKPPAPAPALRKALARYRKLVEPR